MEAMPAQGNIPITTPEQRARATKTTMVAIGVLAALVPAWDHAYIHPVLQPPLGFRWVFKHKSWTLRLRAGSHKDRNTASLRTPKPLKPLKPQVVPPGRVQTTQKPVRTHSNPFKSVKGSEGCLLFLFKSQLTANFFTPTEKFFIKDVVSTNVFEIGI